MNREQRRKRTPEISAYQEGFNEGFEQAAPQITKALYVGVLMTLRENRRNDVQCARFLRQLDDHMLRLANDAGDLDFFWEQIGMMLDRSEPQDRPC